MNRRSLLAGGSALAAGAAALAAVGCGDDDSATPKASASSVPGGTGSPTPAPTPAAAAIVRGGTLLAGTASDATTFEPIVDTSATTHRFYFYALFDPLLTYGDAGQIVGNLAMPTISGNTLTLKLRDKVQFSDGTPLNADAVDFHIKRILNPDTKSRERPNFLSVDTVTVVDPLTVQIKTKGTTVSPILLPSLAGQGGMVGSPAAIQKYGKDYPFKPVGTGPFVLDSYTVNDRTIFKKNPNYWKMGADNQPLPYLDGITVRFIPEQSTALTEVRTGGIHVLTDVGDPSNVKLLRSESSLNVIETPQARTYWMGMDIAGPTQNLLVRQAIEYAIDRDALNQGIFDGVGKVTPSFMAQKHWAFDASVKSYSFDLNKAKALMQQAGVSSVDVRLLVTNKAPDQPLAEAIKSQLAKVGINVTINAVPVAQWVQGAASCNTDLSIGVLIEPVYEPYSRFAPLLEKGGGGNWTCFDDAQVTQLIESTGGIADMNDRKKVYSQVQNAMADQAIYAWLPQIASYIGASKSVNNIVFDAEGATNLTGSYIKKA
jgi:peptide/nickel transport system substrate-binding protein